MTVSSEGLRERGSATASESPAPAAGAQRPRRRSRVAVIGVSTSETCGVRDHAVLLTDALSHEHVECSRHWLDRRETALCAMRVEIRRWTRSLAAEFARQRPDVVLLHYSVFSYSYRGVPIFVRPTLAAMRASRIPLVTILHEFAYPWRRAGLRGTAWALSQRALLIEVMRASAAAVVTMDDRAQWLSSRRWLPRRPLAVAPVFSNLPRAAVNVRPDRPRAVVGLFGYSHEATAASLVLDALRLLVERGRPVELTLLGAPGRSSAVGERWLTQARERTIDHALSFSGRLPAQDLSDALSACDVLVCADAPGPTSRKTTVAASLASGTPVVAIDGPSTWSELTRAAAMRVVPPEAEALADAIAALLDDRAAREELGARGRAFAESRMDVSASARALAGLLDSIAGSQPLR
jgi:glycosyltransferase involved in cell wall biosynthesis